VTDRPSDPPPAPGSPHGVPPASDAAQAHRGAPGGWPVRADGWMPERKDPPATPGPRPDPGAGPGAETGNRPPEQPEPPTTPDLRPGHDPGPGAETSDQAPEWPEPPTDAELAGLCPDPFAGPPDGPDEWLAGLSAFELDAVAEATAVTAAAVAGRAGQEAMAAGFTHRDPSPCATGFAAGGPLDLLAPDPVLAGYAQDAFEAGLGTLGDDELVGLLCAARRLSSWQAAMELAAVTELDSRRIARAGRPGSGRASEHVSDELAAALRLTGRSADALLGLARQLARTPAVLAALFAGVIDRGRAAVFATELAVLGNVAAAAVAAAFCQEAALMTTGQLRAALRRMVLAIDPGAARRRAEDGRADARVEAWQEGSGNGAIAGRELPAAEMIAADKRISVIARTLQAAGAPGTLDQLRAAVFSALLIGRDPGTLLPESLPESGTAPGNSSAGQATSSAASQATGSHPGRPASSPTGSPAAQAVGDPATGHPGSDPSGRSASEATGTGPRPGGSAPDWMAGLVGSINLTMPLASWLGHSDAPGEAAGLGPLDASTCRGLAGYLAAHAQSQWCMTLTGPGGRAVAHACARNGPGPGPGLARQGSPRSPRSPDSPSPPETLSPPAIPSPQSTSDPPEILSPPGTPSPPGVPSPPGTLGSGLTGPNQVAWLAALRFGWLEQGACGHRLLTPAYRPGPKLRHLIEIRQRTCAFPSCRRPARRCDIDHTQPWDQGGLTCECNCAPLCRQHHQAKQATGWQLDQHEPGVLTWTLPHGRSYTARPDSYPT
jgi:hypothetical protein